MWDEEINKKIKDAADQYHPAYDDAAWANMEKMLDQHLPQKKERRRVIYFLPVILILAGLLFFINYSKRPADIVPVSKIGKRSLSQTGENKSNPQAEKASPTFTAKQSPEPEKSQVTPVNSNKPRVKKANINSNEENTSGFSPKQKIKTAAKDRQVVLESAQRGHQAPNKKDVPFSVGINAGEPAKPVAEGAVSTPVAVLNKSLKKPDTAKIIKDESDSLKAIEIAKTVNSENLSANKQSKTKRALLQHFRINLSAGPDVSAVSLSNAGKITTMYGTGLSYAFGNRFTLRTGFYVAKKIYSVDGAEYYASPGSTWNANLQSVAANCKVYEIPLNLSYNFNRSRKHSWFASAGLSSYLMKRESYVYYYKTPSGSTWDKSWTVTNQNKHYFSVLDVSGGYAYSLNKHLTFMAEPYVKMPLSGIGLGKIKLNSAGILFTLAVKPF